MNDRAAHPESKPPVAAADEGTAARPTAANAGGPAAPRPAQDAREPLSLENRCRLVTGVEPQSLVIQDFTPFDACIDWTLSRRYWEIEGTHSFRSGDVPFIVNNDGRLSEDAATLFLANVDAARECGSSPAALHVLELGSGSGLFAKLFLDALRRLCRERRSDVYDRTKYFITDGSPVILQQIQSSGLLGEHSDRVVFAHVEAQHPGRQLDELLPPSASEDAGYQAVFANYLLDNLPCKILHLDGKRTHELMVQTVLDERATKRSSGKLDLEKVRALQADDSPEARRELVALYPTFLTNTRYDRVERRDLPRPDDLPSEQSTKGRSRLYLHNYGALQCLDEVVARLAPDGFILIADYGHDAKQPPDEVLEFQHYGGSIAIGINFGQLDDVYARRPDVRIVAPDKGWSHQLARLITPDLETPIAELFTERFDVKRLESLDRMVKDARALVENSQFEAARWKFKAALQAQPGNWALHEEIAGFMVYNLAQYESAYDMAQHALTINPLSSNLWNILGDTLFHLDRLDEAARAYLQALKLNERDARSQLNVANMFIVQGDYEGALRLIAEALCFDKKGEYRDTLMSKQTEALLNMAKRHQEDLTRTLNRFRGHRDLPTPDGPSPETLAD